MSAKLSATTKTLRKVMIGMWLTIILACVGYYLANPSAFTAENIASFLTRFQGAIWIAYLVFSILRGITLLPSTPLVLAGTMLFPGQPWAVLGVSMTGILLSSTMIYYFSDLLGFDEYFERKNPDLSHKVKAKLEHPLGFLFVAGWAFFPLVPTDLVCYVAGTTKMNFAKFIAAVGVGEVILCSFYIFFGGAFVNYMR